MSYLGTTSLGSEVVVSHSPLKAQMAPEDFETLRQYGAGLNHDDEIDSSDARKQVRRTVFFLHDIAEDKEQGFLRAFLRSNMLLDFVRCRNKPARR